MMMMMMSKYTLIIYSSRIVQKLYYLTQERIFTSLVLLHNSVGEVKRKIERERAIYNVCTILCVCVCSIAFALICEFLLHKLNSWISINH